MTWKPITRRKVHAEPGAVAYFGEETPAFTSWPDKWVDLVLNGPTISGTTKAEIRAALRETYAALEGYEAIGPLATPFHNDPAAIVARAFRDLYPGLEYTAQLVPTLEDDAGGPVFGQTFFPDDGGVPVISISAEAPANAVPELLAHELAHLVAGVEADHGPDWEAALDAIGARYDDLLSDLFPEDLDAVDAADE